MQSNPLDTRMAVDEVLRALPFAIELRSTGSEMMYDLVFDIENAIEQAELTNEEHVIFDLYYVDGHTLDGVSKRTDIPARTVARRVDSIRSKVSGVFERWETLDGEIN